MRSARIVAVTWLAIGATAAQVLVKPEWGVVLSEDQAKVFWKPRLCNRPAPGPIEGIWTPDEETIRRLEAALGPALQAAIEHSTLSQNKPVATDFYRQYAGFIVAGKRIVYINGLHRQTVDGRSTPWRTQALSPCDGGMLFFGAEYAVETGVVSNIVFNGGGRGRVG